MNDAAQPRLTVAIATMAQRFSNISLEKIPEIDSVIWHIFVQEDNSETISVTVDIGRPDITFTKTSGLGAARNRNSALENVSTDFLLFADDDLEFHDLAISKIINVFDASRDVDFLCGRLKSASNLHRKNYSADGSRVRWFNCGKVGTPELAVRMSSIKASGVLFDETFGAGAANWLGDEYVFLCDMLGVGLRGMHVNLTFATHADISSGSTFDQESMIVRRRVFIRALGRWKSLPVRVLFAWRHRKKLDPRSVFRFLSP
jgi:glycosyltransferase involved in cell wall biosynthesis